LERKRKPVEMKKKVTVVGDGGWGTALALVLNENGHSVTVWGPFQDYAEKVSETRDNDLYLPGVPIPEEISWTWKREEAANDAEVAILAAPTRYFSDVVASFKGAFPERCRFISVAKGLDRDTHRTMTELAEDLLETGPVAALSGPSHAEEVARRVPTAVVLGTADQEQATVLQSVLAGPRFRVYTSADVTGVQLGGALKNVIAIAVGVSDGIGFGDNTRAALITRGLTEMTRLGVAMGASPATFAGLSGMGDLVVTCTSGLSRNRSVGERLGRGETIDEILGGMKQAAEGVWNCAAARELAREKGVEIPITEQVYSLLHEGKPPHDAVEALLTRDFRPE
jgi:glycerol-3-phosphate dehydrogenase (NAD(P)+)